MAQSVARALLSARFCRRRCSLFSALGNPKAFRDYLVCRRRTFACAARAYARLRRWSRDALESGLDAKRSLNDELFQGLRAIGLVTDTMLTDPTSAAFYAHPIEPSDVDKIAAEFVDRGNIDIAMGGGAAQFLPITKGGSRQDNRDLLLELRGNGFDIVRTRTELETIPAWRRPKLFGVFDDGDLAFTNQLEQRNQQPSLSDMVRRAIQLLQYNTGGYFLVVDAGLMRKAAQENNGERTLSQTVELDRAVGIARSYGGPKSTIIVCGDLAMGGLSLNGFPFRKDSGETQETEQPEPAAFYTKSALVTVEDVVAFGSGPGTDALQGVLDSTAVFEILRDEL